MVVVDERAVVVVIAGWRLGEGPERPTMADVRLDWGPGRWEIVDAAGEDGRLVEAEGWEGGSDEVLSGVVVLAVVSNLYIRTPPSRQAVANRSKPRTLKGAHWTSRISVGCVGKRAAS